MIKSLRFHRQPRQKVERDHAPEKAPALLPARGFFGSRRAEHISKTKSSSTSSLETLMSTGATESLVSHQNSFRDADLDLDHDLDDPGRVVDERKPIRSLFPGSCLRVKTQEESLQHKYQGGKIADATRRADLVPPAVQDVAASPTGSVRFSKANIYLHGIILGDNPSVTSGGPPVSIEWRSFETYTVPIDDDDDSDDDNDSYEEGTGRRRWNRGRRHEPQPVLAVVRRGRLLRAGHTHAQILRAERQVRAVQNQQYRNLPWHVPPKNSSSSSVDVSSNPQDSCVLVVASNDQQRRAKGVATLWKTRPWLGGRKVGGVTEDDSDSVVYVDTAPDLDDA